MMAWSDSSSWKAAPIEVLTRLRQDLPGGHRDPRHWREAGHGAGQDGRPHHRRARRHPRGRPHAHQRPGHLRRRRCHRSQGLRDRRVEPDCAGRTGEPAGPDRGRCDLRTRFPLPRHAGHLDHRIVRRRRRLDRRQRENAQATRRHGLRERSTSSRIRTPVTTPAPRCSG